MFKNKLVASFTGAVALIAAVVAYWFISHHATPLKLETILAPKDFYSLQVQPIFNQRCVACHSCYNSPCQLNLSSYEGVMRGANKINIYDFPKLDSRPPTRLYIDAHSPAAWHTLGFFSVTKNSLLATMTELPGAESGKQKTFPAEESRVCPADGGADLKTYVEKNPAGRMPYGLPKLADHEQAAIKTWLKESSEPLATDKMEAKILEHSAFRDSVLQWEALFNGEDLQARLSSRYIFEHLFLAHLYFEGQPNIFFRLVRSKTRSGAIEEIATAYPFDNPGPKVFYRLRPVTNTLTLKDHIPFPLTDKKFAWLKEQFYQAHWPHPPKEMPPYGRDGANPFKTFIDIPTEARARFFVDEAGYHVMTFIKGPVCRGQTALNVINDHFWVMFTDPKHDAMVQDPELEKKIAENSAFPAQAKDDVVPFADYRKRYWESVAMKSKSLADHHHVLGLDDIWSGDKENTNALLTIYRHFDSAEVLRGFHGDTPRTVWVIDYQVFESIYYNLTAGYNVFGPLLHQVNSRLYMEMSRLASEDMFLSFLPTEKRAALRLAWNRPTPEKKESLMKLAIDFFLGSVKDKLKFDYPYSGGKIESEFKTDAKDAKLAFVDQLLKTHFEERQLRSGQDYFKNDFAKLRPTAEPNAELQKLAELGAPHVRFLPDTILLRVDGEPYTLIHNKEHYNVSMMFLEDDLREPNADSLDVVHGIATAYANVFVRLKKSELSDFVEAITHVDSQSASEAFIKKFGVARMDSKFWDDYAWFSEKSPDALTNESGLLDLNRYLDL